MKICNKIESCNAIKNLHLNQFPEEIFEKGQEDRVVKFLNKYPASYYALRDKSKSGGKTNHKIKYEEVLEKIKVYTDTYSINVSSYNYVENQIIVGEILITKNYVYILYSTNNTYSLRDAYNNPDFNAKIDLLNDRELNKIPYFDYIYKYVITHNLQNVVIEFALFNKPVGIYNENIIIYELRTEY